MPDHIYPVIIIGGGPAALTAALYTSRANLAPLVLMGGEPGGQLMLTSLVENWPGVANGIMGPELMQNMMTQAKHFGAELKFELVTAVDFSQRPFVVQVGETTYHGQAVIVATGAAAKWLGVPGEAALIGKGVSSCANCDAAFFKDKITGVVGGGDAACEDALALTKFASAVHMFVRGSEFRASKIMTDRVQHHEKITIHYQTAVTEVFGEQSVSGVKLKNNQTGEEKTFDLQGLFVAIGHAPATDIFRGQVDIDDHGFIKIGPRMSTSVPGVFVAGDVDDFRYKQAITAAAEGCRAALEAEWWIEGKKQG